MGRFDSDRLLKQVWLANGFLILLGLILLAGLALFAALSDVVSRRAEAVIAPAPTSSSKVASRPRAVRYSLPQEVRGTRTQLVEVFHGEGYERSFGLDGSRGQYSSYVSTPTVNVIFLEPDGTTRLLLDRAAFIRSLNYPDTRDDSLQHWIAYDIVFDDTNRDGRLDDADAAALYLSDLDGTNFRRVMPDGWSVVSHTALEPTRLLITAIPSPGPDRGTAEEQPQRAFVYDISANRLTSHAQLDSLTSQAGRVLSRPRP